MITYPRYLETQGTTRIRLLGIGNAGIGILNRVTGGFPNGIETAAINTDQQSLAQSHANIKISIGPMTTHGLGTGGDPEMGLEAARESRNEIQKAISGSDIVFLCAGLGGGTASGTAPLIADMARQNGSLVVAVVTTPFGFEGRRRTQQAADALRALSQHADAVLHFENDRLSQISAPHAVASETFAACDRILLQAITSLPRILNANGPMPVSLPDLLTILRAGDGNYLFGFGEASGDQRAQQALERVLRSELLDSGRLLEKARSVLVHISGPSNLEILEVDLIMREISKNVSPSAMLQLGISASGDYSSPLIVTLIGKCGSARSTEAPRPSVTPTSVPMPVAQPVVNPPKAAQDMVQPHLLDVPATPVEKTSHPKVQQPLLPLDPITRGRFDKIEPTIVEGEDLDVPTFLRRKIKK
jgi:cell division protein FtsZ